LSLLIDFSRILSKPYQLASFSRCSLSWASSGSRITGTSLLLDLFVLCHIISCIALVNNINTWWLWWRVKPCCNSRFLNINSLVRLEATTTTNTSSSSREIFITWLWLIRRVIATQWDHLLVITISRCLDVQQWNTSALWIIYISTDVAILEDLEMLWIVLISVRFAILNVIAA